MAAGLCFIHNLSIISLLDKKRKRWCIAVKGDNFLTTLAVGYILVLRKVDRTLTVGNMDFERKVWIVGLHEPIRSKHLAPDPKGLKRLTKRKQKRKSRGVSPTGGITGHQSAHDFSLPLTRNKYRGARTAGTNRKRNGTLFRRLSYGPAARSSQVEPITQALIENIWNATSPNAATKQSTKRHEWQKTKLMSALCIFLNFSEARVT